MSEKESILIIRSRMQSGGPGRQIYSEIKELLERGYRIILVTGGGEFSTHVEELGVKCYVIENLLPEERLWYKNFSSILKIKQIIEDEKITIVYGFNTASTAFAYVAMLFSKVKPRFINSVLGMGKEWFLKLMPFRHIVCSKAQKNKLISMGVKGEKLYVNYPSTLDMKIYNKYLYSEDKLRKKLSLQKDDILIGTVMMGNKGGKDYVDALNKILLISENVYHVFVGTSSVFDEYKKELENSPHKNRVFFLGFQKNIPQIMKEIDIYSHYIGDDGQETFGMVLTEAMVMETPVVASDIGGISDIVVKGVTGYLVRTVDEHVDRIKELVLDNNIRNEMGKNGYNRVIEHFTLEKTINNLEEIFQEL